MTWLVTGSRLRSPESLSHCQFLTSEDSTSYRRSGPQPDLCSGSCSGARTSAVVGGQPRPGPGAAGRQVYACGRGRHGVEQHCCEEVVKQKEVMKWMAVLAVCRDEACISYMRDLEGWGRGVEWSSRQHTCEHGEIFSITFRNILWGLILKIANIFKNIKCLFTSEFRCWQNQLRPMASMPAGHCYAARWWPAPSVTWSCWPGVWTLGAGTGPIHPSVRWGQYKLHVASKSDKSYI